MNLDIKITEVVNGYRLDINDWNANDFYKENIETMEEVFRVLDSKLKEYQTLQLRVV